MFVKGCNRKAVGADVVNQRRSHRTGKVGQTEDKILTELCLFTSL